MFQGFRALRDVHEHDDHEVAAADANGKLKLEDTTRE